MDVALLVPFQPPSTSWIDASMQGRVASARLVATRARDRTFEWLGSHFTTDDIGEAREPLAHRSLTAVALATSLERAGLSWRVLDPGSDSLARWRRRLEGLRASAPRLVAISSTFIVDGLWMASLCSMVRALFPAARIAVGGYAYATDVQRFLTLDADILCIGEGEVRIVDIVRAVRDGRGLEDIPGLYLHAAGGGLRFTGSAEPLRLDDLPLPDWSLAARIEPAARPGSQAMRYTIETQRGCVFKCAFCTYRTLAAPVQGSVDRAVAAIRDVALRGRGEIYLADGTATFPRARFRSILTRLIEEGGSPLPISLFARVSDLDDATCALMRSAGVRFVQVGQESGDQGVLDAMRKGTRLDQVAPAVAALARHEIVGEFLFMYGFPGETQASMERTRELIATINEGQPSWPAVRTARIELFAAQDFASVAGRERFSGDDRRFGWEHLTVSPGQAAEEMLRTYLVVSRVAHAPATAFRVAEGAWHAFARQPGADLGLGFFRWAKALDRAIGIFVEAELEGKSSDVGLLPGLREMLRRPFPERSSLGSRMRAVRSRVINRITWWVGEECVNRPKRGVGPFTRAAIAREVWQSTGSPAALLRSLATGDAATGSPVGLATPAVAAHAEQLVQLGVTTGKRKLTGA